MFFIAATVGIAVLDTVITSSPGLIPADFKAIIKASVPLPTAAPYLSLYFLINFFSNLFNWSPKNIFPDNNVLSIEEIIFFLNFLYSSWYVQFLIIDNIS